MKGIKGIGKVWLIFALILSLISCNSNDSISKTASEPTKQTIDMLNEVSALTNSVKFKDARKLLEDKYELIEDYDMGLNAYGFLEFHIYKNYKKAEKLYQRAIKLNPESSEHYMGIGNLYEAKGEYNKAIKCYEKAVKNTAVYSDLPLNPGLALIYKDIGRCYLKLKDTKKALEALEKASENNPFSIEANALLQRLYVQKEEYDKAYEVWKKDNLIDESTDHVYKGILEWNKLYKDALEDKNGITHLKMAKLYAELVLYDEAAIEYERAYAEDQNNEDINNKLKEIKSYLSFRDELQALLDDYYRGRCINGTKEELTFYQTIKPAYEKISPLFPQAGDNPAIISSWIDTLNKEIEKKFRVRIENIKANGSMLGVHFGRIVDSSMIHSALWGQEADLKVITLKNMTSNGLGYWMFMGKLGGVAGWSISPTEIVRVILDNGYDTLLQTASLYNEDVREEYVKKMGTINIDKEERDPLELFYSPEIQVQFSTRQIDIEVDKAKAKGISDSKLQSYIFDKLEKDFNIKTSIFIHESQHSIDNKNRTPVKWLGESEYRPKLSELAYGDMPFWGLKQFYSSSIGKEVNDTHVRANTQVFKDIVQYIYDHNSKFPQIDVKKNILAQLYKLSDDDVRAIAIDIFEKNYGVKYDS